MYAILQDPPRSQINFSQLAGSQGQLLYLAVICSSPAPVHRTEDFK